MRAREALTASGPNLAEPDRPTGERTMTASPAAVYRAWTERFDRGFALPGSLKLEAKIGAAFSFETESEGQRHSQDGRFLRLVPDALVERTWAAPAVLDAETTGTGELLARGAGSQLRLTHRGFRNASSVDRHLSALPRVPDRLDHRL
ncbi:MAG TPA: SRPBCC domain-containing protein [Thermoplasmata archaeon]|nr:SRPBCC domain-containing protein [Thermoplasmata archaeon]